jgi:hypothetical protein
MRVTRPRPPAARGGLAAPMRARRATTTTTTTPRTTTRAAAKKPSQRDDVSYGRSWFEQTRDPMRGRTVAQEIERRRKANYEANNGRERKDLITENWDGSVYRGSANNVLTWIIVAAVGAPVAGLIFAYCTYGKLWG